jgi:hypothetical protein
MSSLTGHWKITQAAVRELSATWSKNPLVTGLGAAALPDAAVTRDILDVLCGGHWADFGQKHHFMRKFDGQSPAQAYREAVEWIRTNALQAAQILAARVKAYFPYGVTTGRAANHVGKTVFTGISWQQLGNAVHALEDSFAAGHAVRDEPAGPMNPGAITHIKRYAGQEKEGHEHGDAVWQDEKGGFSRDGRFAIEAVKHLLLIVLVTAQTKEKSPTALVGWDRFVGQWLKASPKLSQEADKVFELIDRFYTGARIGASNVKTVNMDEEGLAKALFQEVGSDTKTTLTVFVRLDEHYNSDADDVAELYVKLVKTKGGPVLSALKSNKLLVERLIKVMDEGWTSAGEKECIEFLRGLK